MKYLPVIIGILIMLFLILFMVAPDTSGAVAIG